jgi:DNA polymerase III delta subunit
MPKNIRYNISMIVTLAGDNSFALRTELDKIVGSFVDDQGDLALERIDAEEAEFSRIQEAATALPMLTAKRLVVLRSPSANKQFSENFEQILDDVPETNHLILVEPTLDKRLSYAKLLKKKTEYKEFTELDETGLANWLTQQAKEREAKLSASDAHYLVQRVGANQQLLSSELEKLILFNSDVSKQTIDLLTEPSPQSTIFQLLTAAFEGRGQQALKLYEDQQAQKVETPQIIAMLTWQLHLLALVKAGNNRSVDQIAREARLNPFSVRKSKEIGGRLTWTDLRRLVSGLVDIDFKSKSTNLDADEALQNYLVKLAT